MPSGHSKKPGRSVKEKRLAKAEKKGSRVKLRKKIVEGK
jgi:hypothetical protein